MRSAGIARPDGERTPGTGGGGISGPAVRRGGGAFGAEPGTRLSRRVRGLTAGAGAHVSRGDGAVPGTARLRRCRVPPARPAQPAVSAGRAHLSAPGHESVSGSPPGDQGDRGRGLARDRAARAARPVQGPGARELARGRDGDAGARGRDAGAAAVQRAGGRQPPDTLPWPPTPALLPERTLTGPAFQSLAAGLVAGAAVVALPSLMAQGKDATGARFAVGAAVGVSGLVGFFARKPRPLDANVRANASQRDAWKRRVDAVKAENAARLRTTRLVVRAGPETIAERGSP